MLQVNNEAKPISTTRVHRIGLPAGDIPVRCLNAVQSEASSPAAAAAAIAASFLVMRFALHPSQGPGLPCCMRRHLHCKQSYMPSFSNPELNSFDADVIVGQINMTGTCQHPSR